MDIKQEMEDTIEILEEKLKSTNFEARKIEWNKKSVERSVNSKTKEFDNLTKINYELTHSIEDCKVMCSEHECTSEKLRNDNNYLSQSLMQKEIELSASGDAFALNVDSCHESNAAVIKETNKANAPSLAELQGRNEEVEMQLHKA